MAISSQEERISKWLTPGYREDRAVVYRRIRDYLLAKGPAPARILDIGSGLGLSTIPWQREFQSQLWFLEGDQGGNSAEQNRQGKFNTAQSMQFYCGLETLQQFWQEESVDYTLVDARKPEIDPAVQFDLIVSTLSCGWHYPLSTYRDLIAKHLAPKGSVIMDFRLPENKYSQGCAYRTVDRLYYEGRQGTFAIELL